MDLNSKILTGFNRTQSAWQRQLSKAIYLLMPPRWIRDFLANRHAPETRKLIEMYKNVAIKDPRFCLTLPYWDKQTDIQAMVVCLRNPASSINSLKRRQNIPTPLGRRFWKKHMEGLFDFVAKKRHERNIVVIDLDKLVSADNESLLQEINTKLNLGKTIPEMQSALKEVFERRLLRSQVKQSYRLRLNVCCH